MKKSMAMKLSIVDANKGLEKLKKDVSIVYDKSGVKKIVRKAKGKLGKKLKKVLK